MLGRSAGQDTVVLDRLDLGEEAIKKLEEVFETTNDEAGVPYFDKFKVPYYAPYIWKSAGLTSIKTFVVAPQAKGFRIGWTLDHNLWQFHECQIVGDIYAVWSKLELRNSDQLIIRSLQRRTLNLTKSACKWVPTFESVIDRLTPSFEPDDEAQLLTAERCSFTLVEYWGNDKIAAWWRFGVWDAVNNSNMVPLSKAGKERATYLVHMISELNEQFESEWKKKEQDCR
jgi:hypothetical protein